MKATKINKPVGIGNFGMVPRKEYEEKLRIARERSHAARGDLWTEEEEETLKKGVRQGYTVKEIAQTLPRRTVVAVDDKYRRMQKKGEI